MLFLILAINEVMIYCTIAKMPKNGWDVNLLNLVVAHLTLTLSPACSTIWDGIGQRIFVVWLHKIIKNHRLNFLVAFPLSSGTSANSWYVHIIISLPIYWSCQIFPFIEEDVFSMLKNHWKFIDLVRFFHTSRRIYFQCPRSRPTGTHFFNCSKTSCCLEMRSSEPLLRTHVNHTCLTTFT